MKREFTSAAAWVAAASWLEQAAAALIFLVIARLIGVETFGLASMAFAFLFIGEFLVRDTITEAIVARPELEDGRLEATFYTLAGFSALVTVALAGVALIAGLAYGNPDVVPLLLAASPVVLMIGLAGVSTALLRRRMQYKTLAIRTIVGVLSGGAVGILMALNGFGAWSLVGQRLTEIGINSVLAVLGARWRPTRGPARGDLAIVRGLGPDVVRLRTWTLIVMQTPVVMLGMFADPRAAGLFAFAARLVEIILKLSVRVIQGVAQSALAALRRRAGGTATFFLDLTELSALAGFLSFAGLGVIAQPLTRLLLGPDWAGAGAALPFLAVSGAALSLTAMQEAYLLATDRIGGFLAAIRAEAVLGLVLIGLASPFGAVPVAAAAALRSLLILPFCTRAALAGEALPASGFVGALRAPALVAAIMGLVLLGWRVATLGRLGDAAFVGSAMAIGAAVAAAVVAVFMPQTRNRLMAYFGDRQAG